MARGAELTPGAPPDLGACDAVEQAMAHPNELDALYAFLVAAAVAALLTPLTKRLARAVGAIDEPRERGLSERPTPLLGGLAIFAGALVAALILLPSGYVNLKEHQHQLWHGVLLAAAVITVVGALDDRFDLHPGVKLAGQIVAAAIAVHFGVAVKAITLPFIGELAFPNAGITNAGPLLTVVALVAMMNVVNFSDGVDGLAAGVCAIIAVAMAVIAFDLGRQQPGVLAALTAGAALGFLFYNFPPASSFMGDCGRQPAGAADGGHRGRGGGQDGRRGLVRAAPDPARGAVPGHHVRRAQAAEVPPADLPLRQRALPPPDGPDRLQQQAHDRLPVCVDADAGRARAGAPVHPLQRPQRPLRHRLDARARRARTARAGGERVPRVRARDPQVPAPGLDPPAAAAPGGLTSGDRAGRGEGPRNR